MRARNLAAIVGVASVFFGIPFIASADILGQKVSFFVDPAYDAAGRKQVTATLLHTTEKLYFFGEDDWWNTLNAEEKMKTISVFENLGSEFSNPIYPEITRIFGQEQKPGLDRDEHITVLIHRLKETRNGYTRTSDGYSKFEAATSNEREMIYLNASFIAKETMPSLLAHEFFHLIYFNQKELKYGVSDDLWIQEGLAEFAVSLAGHDADPESYSKGRIRDFVSNPRDSLTEWRGLPTDYGTVNIFFRYIADKYGANVLADVVRSKQVGIAGFESALKKNGIDKTFQDIFTDWTVALFLNNCLYGGQYCFTSPALESIRVAPFTSFLPFFGNSELRVTNQSKDWSGNWHKISGGKGKLILEFNGNPAVKFKLPYILQKSSGEYELNFLVTSSVQEGQITVEKFGTDYTSLIIIPSIQSKVVEFSSFDPSYFFSWTASVREEGQPEIPGDTQSTQELLRQIAELQAKVAELQRLLLALQNPVSCADFSQNLEYGMRNSQEVRCLQEFLKNQGPGIYPEGLVTGYFGPLTKAAVIRFQEKYKSEILLPIGYTFGTGYVGTMTRQKISQILDKK